MLQHPLTSSGRGSLLCKLPWHKTKSSIFARAKGEVELCVDVMNLSPDPTLVMIFISCLSNQQLSLERWGWDMGGFPLGCRRHRLWSPTRRDFESWIISYNCHASRAPTKIEILLQLHTVAVAYTSLWRFSRCSMKPSGNACARKGRVLINSQSSRI